MARYPVEIRRCEHIKTSGAQCGSPALRSGKFCYYHQECQSRDVECYADWDDPYSTGQIKLPAFDDAHGLQYVIRQVMQLLLQKQIDHKTAGLLLYGLQIASSNLKRMDLEKPRPTQVVVDAEKVAETPLGMTPWSASGNGHDPEGEETPTHSQRARMSGAPEEPETQKEREKREEWERYNADMDADRDFYARLRTQPREFREQLARSLKIESGSPG
jgi:hypothetical protein